MQKPNARQQTSANQPAKTSRSTVSIFILYFLIANFSSLQAGESNKVYFYKDKHGNPVYADKPPASGDYQTIENSELKGINQQNLAKIKRQVKNFKPAISKKPNSKPPTKNKQADECEIYQQKIEQTQAKLKKRQKAATFEQLKKQLRQLRELKRKNC